MEYLKIHPGMHLENDDIRTFVAEGVTLFYQEFNLPIEERDQFDMEGKVQQTIFSCIARLLHYELYEDVGKQSAEGQVEDDDGEEEDEADEEDEEEEQGEDSSEYLLLQGHTLAKFIRHKVGTVLEL